MKGWNLIAGLFCLALTGLTACGAPKPPPESPVFHLNWPESGQRIALSAAEMETWGAEKIPSAFFDRAMQYQGSTFTAVGFDTILKRHDPGVADAVLLDCFDDYQGLVTLEDVRHYRLRLATQIHLQEGTKAPGWLNPLLLIVPNGANAPFVERFLTANIREVSFVNRDRYYAPLNRVAELHPQSGAGLQLYKDNCVFCHSYQGVGGNKGGPLVTRFDFGRFEGRQQFQTAFMTFHQNNPDKQNVAQFLSQTDLQHLAVFLESAAGS